jgi:hypothetical protein
MDKDKLRNALRDIEVFYLDYINNYLSVSSIAQAYGLSNAEAVIIIVVGKLINNKELY